MGAREASIFICLVDGFLDHKPPLPSVHETDALETFDLWLARSPGVNRLGVRALLRLMDLAPLVLGGGRPLRRLQPGRRRLWLKRLERVPVRPLRELVRALKSLTLLCYYGDPAVMAGLGFDAQARVTVGRELRRAEGRP